MLFKVSLFYNNGVDFGASDASLVRLTGLAALTTRLYCELETLLFSIKPLVNHEHYIYLKSPLVY